MRLSVVKMDLGVQVFKGGRYHMSIQDRVLNGEHYIHYWNNENNPHSVYRSLEFKSKIVKIGWDSLYAVLWI